MTTKKETRKKLRKILERIDEKELARAGERACMLLVKLPEFARAETLMLFLSMPGEIDTEPVIRYAFAQGKQVVVPKIYWDRKTMAPVSLTSLVCPMEIGRRGIREPATSELISIETIDLVVTPGLGFDKHGNRIGRGAGFYDRFLSTPGFRGICCGFAAAAQVLDHIPTGPRDVPMDLLVTENDVSRIGSDKAALQPKRENRILNN